MALKVERMNNKKVADELWTFLNQTLSKYPEENGNISVPLPKVKTVIRTNWCSDPFSLGTNSLMDIETKHDHFKSLGRSVDVETTPRRLSFANDATDETRFGNLEASWRSATRQAHELAKLLAPDLNMPDELDNFDMAEQPVASGKGREFHFQFYDEDQVTTGGSSRSSTLFKFNNWYYFNAFIPTALLLVLFQK